MTPLKSNKSQSTWDDYNQWAATYDTVANKTRDLEAMVIRSVLGNESFGTILELGCGTGKNTGWLSQRCKALTAVDFFPGMLQLAREKIKNNGVLFQQADITQTWVFEPVNLITCSLVLEHIEDIGFIFREAFRTLNSGGLFFNCELHPYKQLQGSQAKFEKEGQQVTINYFIHHVSDYVQAAKRSGFICEDLQEWSDSADKIETPRLISFVFRKK